MSSIVAVVKKDLRGYFDQPTGYILLVIFVALISGLGFREPVSYTHLTLPTILLV